MKTSALGSLTVMIFLTFLTTAFTSIVTTDKSATFKVYGGCPMCVERIQDAALENEHVKSADWNLETKMINVVYDEDKVSLQEIHESIAAVGHDTDLVRAPDKKFRKLPECCKYERPQK